MPAAPVLRLIPAMLLLAAGLAAPARAADPAQCLTPEQRRAAVAGGKLVPLAKAIRAAKMRRQDVVNAQLCPGPKGGLVYLLTVLARDGKVSRTVIDAQTGKPAAGH